MSASGTKRPAEIVLGAETRKLRRDLAAAKGEIRGFGKGAAQSIRSTVGTAFAGAFSLASLGGAVSVAKDVLANEKALTRLGIQAEVSDERVRQLATNLGHVSNDTGQFTSELIAGATQIVTLTGDFDLAARSASALGVAATATGAEMTDLAGVAASLGQNLGIAGLKMGEALDALTVQGKKGKVELKELATLLPTASAQFAIFGEKGMGAVTTLGAGLQVVATATGTASEAATAFNALGKSYIANAKRIKKLSGVEVFKKDKNGKLIARDFADITNSLRKSKIGGNQTKIIEALGSEEAFKAFNALSSKWGDFQGLIAAGLQGGGTIEADFKRYIESPAGRIERAWTRAANSLQRAVTPDRVELIARATEQFARALGFVVDHGQQLVTLLGAAKLMQFSMATNKWAEALGGVSTQAGNVTGKLSGAGTQVRGMNRDVSRLGSALGKSVSFAGGLTSTLLASYQATSLLVDAMGIFEDKTLTKASADDLEAKADAAQKHVGQRRTTIANLEEDLRHQKRGAGHTAEAARLAAENSSPRKAAEQAAKAQAAAAKVKETEDQIAFEKSRLRDEELTLTATTIGERDAARGTGALDDIVSNLRARQAEQSGLGRLGSISASAPQVDLEVLKQYAPEAQNLNAAELARVVTILEAQLKEQERLRALQERVSAPQGSSDAGGQAMISAPRTGTLPR